MSSRMPNRLKELVSKNKIRYQADGFDLDLAYIKDNIIAMGFPAENLEGVYRNHLEDVQRFLETKHEKRYKIYNLCLEREYLPTKFKGPVTKYPFKDHNPPPLTMMTQFCKDVKDWLSGASGNVAVIHCKAGKGRTGVMICAYLVFSENMTAEEALDLYASKRTKDSKGVTIPSQRRYVHYFFQLCSRHIKYVPVGLRLVAFRFSSVPNFTAGHNCHIYFTIQEGSSFGKYDTSEAARKGDQNVVIEVNQPCREDIKIDFGCRTMIGKESMFHFWFNTFFVWSSETVDLSQFHRISSRRQQESCLNPSSGPIGIPCQNNGNNVGGNVHKRSSFRSSYASAGGQYSSSFCEADFGGRQVMETRNRLKPELKKELISKALMFMQRGHRPADDLVNLPQENVLTSFKPRDPTFREGRQINLADPNLLSGNPLGGKRSPSSPRLFSRHNRSRNNLNEEALSLTSPTQTFKTLVLTKSELDKANKDKQHKIFPPDFTLTLYFMADSSDSKPPDSPCHHDNNSDTDSSYTDDDDDDLSKIIL